jgi:hypothetical protein
VVLPQSLRGAEISAEFHKRESLAEITETLVAFTEHYAWMEAALITKTSRKATVSLLSLRAILYGLLRAYLCASATLR